MTRHSMKQTLIDAISTMSENDAATVWEIMSGAYEDQEEHCDLLVEQHKMTDADLRKLRVTETLTLAGNVAMATLAEVK